MHFPCTECNLGFWVFAKPFFYFLSQLQCGIVLGTFCKRFDGLYQCVEIGGCQIFPSGQNRRRKRNQLIGFGGAAFVIADQKTQRYRFGLLGYTFVCIFHFLGCQLAQRIRCGDIAEACHLRKRFEFSEHRSSLLVLIGCEFFQALRRFQFHAGQTHALFEQYFVRKHLLATVR